MHSQKRIEWVDLAKGIGIILVVYGHVILGIHDAKLGLSGIGYTIQHSVIYTMHMPLFFFLSGIFAVKWVKREPKVAIHQKFTSLIIPYLIWGIIQGLIMQVFAGQTNNAQGLSQVLRLPIKPYAQFWFLYDLWWIFLIYYVAIHVLKLPTKILFGFSIVLFLGSPWLNLWEFWRIFYQLPFFLVGTMVIEHQDNLSKLKPIILIPLFIVVNGLFIFVNFNTFVTNIFSFIVAMVGILLVISLVQRFRNGVLDYIGKNSMPIYLMHLLGAAGTRIILLKLGVQLVSVHLIFGTLVGLFAPLIALQVFKLLKIDKYLL